MLIFALCFESFAESQWTFKVVGDEWQMNGKPFRYISGAFHYFRAHESVWEDHIKKMANGGLNVIESYVAWNMHEPEKGVFVWEGRSDIVRYFQLCAKYNLFLLLRPGPFIGAEWGLGGYPAWLLKEPNITLQSRDPVHMKHLRDWFRALYTKLKPYAFVNGGGPWLMSQLDNEYGSFGDDKVYLQELADLAHEFISPDHQLYTTDSGSENLMKRGSLVPQAYATVDFGTGRDAKSLFQMQRAINGGHGPYVCSEFYTGWIDIWGRPHNKVPTERVVKALRRLLDLGGNVDFYMYYGGTNFGLMAAEMATLWVAMPTSYDYDAPLSEAGDMTWKWEAIRNVSRQYLGPPPNYPVANSTKVKYDDVHLSRGLPFLKAVDVLTKVTRDTDSPITVEHLNVDYGYAVYRAISPVSAGKLECPEFYDRVFIFVDGALQGMIDGHAKEKHLQIPAGQLEIVAEVTRRVNAGQYMHRRKGLLQNPTIDGVPIKGWKNIGLSFDKLNEIPFVETLPETGPTFFKGVFHADKVGDTWVNTTGWSEGVIWVNGFCIGRHWNIGPQGNYFCPGGVLKEGDNEIIILELYGLRKEKKVSFDNFPILQI
jgi:beta-galactosidase